LFFCAASISVKSWKRLVHKFRRYHLSGTDGCNSGIVPQWRGRSSGYHSHFGKLKIICAKKTVMSRALYSNDSATNESNSNLIDMSKTSVGSHGSATAAA
jgi:hypothetical protein